MGLVSVFKTIGCGFKEVGKGVVRVINVAADVADHPAVAPGLIILSTVAPIKFIQFGMDCVRKINKLAEEIKEEHDEIMSDEEKRNEFAKLFREEFPEASNGDVMTLACILTKLNNKLDEGEEKNGDKR